MTDKKTSQDTNTTGKVLTGMGIAALAAATAGAVFLYGTDAGKKKRKQINSWTLRMKADVMDKMEKMKDWNEDSYHQIVDAVAERYQKIKGIDPEEVGALVKDMRSHWKTLKKHVDSSTPKKKLPARKPKKIAATKPKTEPTETK